MARSCRFPISQSTQFVWRISAPLGYVMVSYHRLIMGSERRVVLTKTTGTSHSKLLLFVFCFPKMYSSILSIQKTPTYNRPPPNKVSLEFPKPHQLWTKKALFYVCNHMTKSKKQSASAAAYIRIAYILVLLLPGRLWCFLLLRDQYDSGPVFLRSKIFRPTPLKVTEDRHFKLIVRLWVVSRCRPTANGRNKDREWRGGMDAGGGGGGWANIPSSWIACVSRPARRTH